MIDEAFPGLPIYPIQADIQTQGLWDILRDDEESLLFTSFGSVILNHDDPEGHITPLARILKEKDIAWVSIDGYGPGHKEKVFAAYNCLRGFIQNRLAKILGYDKSAWVLESSLQGQFGRDFHHVFTLIAKKNTEVGKNSFNKGDTIELFRSYKLSEQQAYEIFAAARLHAELLEHAGTEIRECKPEQSLDIF